MVSRSNRSLLLSLLWHALVFQTSGAFTLRSPAPLRSPLQIRHASRLTKIYSSSVQDSSEPLAINATDAAVAATEITTETLPEIPAVLGEIGPLGKAKAIVAMTRPFTLLPLIFGVLSGSASAYGSAWFGREADWGLFATVMLGCAVAVTVNAASNIVNQIYDIDIDKINKPNRPLCTGEITLDEAWDVTYVLGFLALLPTWFIQMTPDADATGLWAFFQVHQSTFVMAAAMFFSLVYSVPALGRTKESTFGANISIATARGLFLKLGGWSTVASVFHFEPWFLGSVFAFFLLGAASTKDFSDIKGDREGGCRTLPIVYGVEPAAKMIAPFFVVPWFLLPLGAYLQDPFTPGQAILTGDPTLLSVLGVGLAAWGAYVVSLILEDPDAMAETENHPSWTQMYLMMMTAQIGLGAAYLIHL